MARWAAYSKAFKRRVVAETLEPGASVAAVARRHGLNANMVFLWRRDPRLGPGQDATTFLPVEVKPAKTPSIPEPARAGGADEIETALASGHRLTLSGAFDVDTVLRLVSGLSAS